MEFLMSPMTLPGLFLAKLDRIQSEISPVKFSLKIRNFISNDV